ncbi:MAG: cell division protein ZapA [Thiohalomonadaceae bacterium]
MSGDVKQVSVQIMGKEYLVGCRPHELDDLMASAKLLDRKMREIRETGKVIGTERIAVMAALNLAHEVLAGGTPRTQEAVYTRLKAMQEKIDAVLAQEVPPLKV